MGIYPVLHGILVAIVYMLIKHFSSNGNLMLFSNGLLFCNFAMLPFLKIKNWQEIFSFELILKGCLFGITQILIFETLRTGSVANVMVSSIFGGVFVSILGALFLSEVTTFWVYVGGGITFIGAFIFYASETTLFSLSIFSIFAGFLQGATTTMTRKNVLMSISRVSIVVSNFFWGLIVLYLFYGISNYGLLVEGFSQFWTIDTIILGVAVLLTQISLYFSMKNGNTQISSALAMSRVPASFALDYVFFSKRLGWSSFISGIVVVVGIIFTNYFFRKSKNLKEDIS